MKEYDFIIRDSTYQTLKTIADAENDPFSVAVAAQIDPDKFRLFMSVRGLNDNLEANQLLQAAQTIQLSKEKLLTTADSVGNRTSMAIGEVHHLTSRLTGALNKLIQSDVAESTQPISERLFHALLDDARTTIERGYQYLTMSRFSSSLKPARTMGVKRPKKVGVMLSADPRRKKASKRAGAPKRKSAKKR